MRKILVLAAVAIGVVGGLAPAVAARSSAAPFCGITWGSLAKTDPAHTTGPITNVRAGRHGCYDRLVIDLAGPATTAPGPQRAGFDVRYVTRVVEDGSGRPVPLAGGAFLQVIVHATAFNAVTGAPTYTPANRAAVVNVAGFQTFRQVAFAGSFEGQSTFGLGVRARLPFRVFVLAGPGTGSRLVVDVAHRW
jgi:hypothetical protein